jgi:hypothetical protein
LELTTKQPKKQKTKTKNLCQGWSSSSGVELAQHAQTLFDP